MGEGVSKDPFDAALGEAILGYLDALPPEDLVRAFLAMRAPNGVQEEAFLQAWASSAAEREGLLSAAKKLQDAGELRRVRVPARGEGGEPARFLWFRGRTVGNRSIGTRTAHPREVPIACHGAWPAVAPMGRTTTDQVGEEPTGCRTHEHAASGPSERQHPRQERSENLPMVAFNKTIQAGNLTRDPELRFTSEGVPVCEFGLAVNRVRSKDKDAVDFFDVTAWRELGETIANYKKKGDPVLVEGRLTYSSWEAEDGSKRSKVTITAENVQFLGGGASNGEGDPSAGRGGREDREEVETGEEQWEDIPF